MVHVHTVVLTVLFAVLRASIVIADADLRFVRSASMLALRGVHWRCAIRTERHARPMTMGNDSRMLHRDVGSGSEADVVSAKWQVSFGPCTEVRPSQVVSEAHCGV